MIKAAARPNDLPLIPAFYIGTLAIGAAIHANPAILKPVVGCVHAIALALFA